MTNAPAVAAVHRVRASRNRWTPMVVGFAVLVAVVGVLAPLLANDLPLVARIGGTWSFPAFVDWAGTAPPGPGDLSW